MVFLQTGKSRKIAHCSTRKDGHHVPQTAWQPKYNKSRTWHSDIQISRYKSLENDYLCLDWTEELKTAIWMLD